jgi:hypothetical protein
MRIAAITALAIFLFYACGSEQSDNTSGNRAANLSAANSATASGGSAAANQPDSASRSQDPKTVRDFFMLLSEKYFVLEGCEREKDKDCKRAREEYLKAFGEIDIANGYIKGGCDGGQACMEMAIFKRPDGTYLVGLATEAEMMNDNYFLDYANGTWTDVSSSVVPEFNKKNMYVLPQHGTTVQVFAKKIVEKGDDYEVSERGAKLYDLEWKDGKFSKKR